MLDRNARVGKSHEGCHRHRRTISTPSIHEGPCGRRSRGSVTSASCCVTAM